MKTPIIILILLITSIHLKAQNISGKWKGRISYGYGDNVKIYTILFDLQQASTVVKGYTFLYEKHDSLLFMKTRLPSTFYRKQ